MQERPWRQIRGEPARLAERDREVAAWERRVRKKEGAAARGAHRVLLELEGECPSTDVDGWLPSGKRARGEGVVAGQARGTRRWVEGREAGEAAGAPQPTSPSPELTLTNWGSWLPPLWRYAPQPVRREPGTVRGWRAGDVARSLDEVGREDERRAGEARDLPPLRPGRQGREAT